MWFRKPVIYVADTVNPVRIPLNSVLLNKNESLSGNGLYQSKSVKNDWFSVSSIGIQEDPATNEEMLVISINGLTNNLPRLPKLSIDGVEYGGDTVHNFDQNLNFTSAKFYFYLPEEYLSNLEALLGEAELIIDQALFKGNNFATPNMAFDVRLDLDSAV